MKKILIILATLALSLTACADRHQMVSYSNIPVQAQAFIEKYFKSADVSYIERELEGVHYEYKVYLKNATEIEFDHQGNLQSIDCHQKAVPQEIMPSIITDYVRLHHPNLIIVEYQVDMRHQKVGLSNDWELVFDNNGNFLGMDD